MQSFNKFINELNITNKLLNNTDLLNGKVEISTTDYLKTLLLNDVNLLILQDISFQEIAQHILESFCSVLGIKKASFMYYDDKNSALMILASVGFNFDTSTVKQSKDSGISGWVYQNKKTVFAKTLNELPPYLKKFLRDDMEEEILNSQSLLSIPILVDNSVRSILNISEKKDGILTDKDFEFVSEMSSTLFDSIKLADNIKSAEKLKDDMKLAEQIQGMVLPNAIIDYNSVDISAYLKSINFVGGDYYDFFESSNGTLNVLIADVSGHSISSALMVSTMRGIIRTLLKDNRDLGEALYQLNRMISEDSKNNGMYITACFIQYHKDNKYIEYVNCGHQDILHIKKDGELLKWESTSMPIGMWAKESFEPVKIDIDFDDTIFLSTDGLHESINIEGEFFGLDRIDKLVTQTKTENSKELIDKVFNTYKEFTKDQKQDDDMTLLAIKFVNENKATFPSSLNELENIFSWLNLTLGKYIIDQELLMGFMTAVHEAVINAMEHAHKFDESKIVTVEILTSESFGLKVIILDEADMKMEMPEQKDDIISQKRGRGLFLIHHFADEVNYLSNGIEIVLSDYKGVV
jgi:anti-sigma regulatory factor (Ser/Thr protein kinase)/arsenate reductase-like glutaredoxin family protein